MTSLVWLGARGSVRPAEQLRRRAWLRLAGAAAAQWRRDIYSQLNARWHAAKQPEQEEAEALGIASMQLRNRRRSCREAARAVRRPKRTRVPLRAARQAEPAGMSAKFLRASTGMRDMPRVTAWRHARACGRRLLWVAPVDV